VQNVKLSIHRRATLSQSANRPTSSSPVKREIVHFQLDTKKDFSPSAEMKCDTVPARREVAKNPDSSVDTRNS
jgi:hypothetical protein